MKLTIEAGTPIVEDPQRLADVDAIGVDEMAYLRATGRHPTWFANGITDFTWLLPAMPVDHQTNPGNPAPSLHPRYRASPLI